MINNIDKKMIEVVFENIMLNDEFPKFGSPETECSKCMFYNIVCLPSSARVGCYHGWKREGENGFDFQR